MPTPEFVVAQPPAEVIVGDAAPAQRGGISRTLLAGGAIVVVAIAGVLISGKLKTSEKAASSATPAAGATVAVATTPAANPPAVTPPAQTPPTPIVVATPAPKAAEPIVAVDSAAVKKAIADSVARAKRAARDSARAAAAKEAARVADSIEKAKTSPFVIGPSPDEIKAATLQARNGARDCVDALSAHDMPRLKALFARDHTDEVFRIANERRLEASGVQKAAVEVEAADRAKVGFQTVLSWKNANNEDKSVIASLRNIVQKKNGTWSNRCFIDNDGGARY
jgi:hypothetical protein